VSIAASRVHVVPARIAAGNTALMLINASGRPQTLTLVSADGRLRRSTRLGLAHPAELKLKLPPGRYSIEVGSGEIKPVALGVAADA
jgi:hypothetical protein